jgi:GMP synthase-like glutamine amidotransferase
MDISNTPLIALTKKIQTMVFIEYPHEYIVFLLGFVRAMQYPSKILEICYGAQRIFNMF